MRTAAVYQRDMFTRRYRKIPAVAPSELQFQISLVEQCRWRLRDDVLMFHCPNGEHRDKRTAAKLKAMGVLPGVADLIFMWPEWLISAGQGLQQTCILFLELKAHGRKPSAAQMGFYKLV